MNRHPLLSKLLLIAFLMAVLAIALALVRDIVNERSTYRNSATDEVARAHAGAQVLSGPVIWLPYTESFVRRVKPEVDGGATREELVTEEHVHIVFPRQLDTRSQLDTETRQRGIFPVTVFNSRHHSTGHFVWADIVPRNSGGQIRPGQPLLLMGVGDARGLAAAPLLRLGEQELQLVRAPAGAPLPLAASLDGARLKPGATLALEVRLELAGTGRIGWVPLADENSVTLTSPWPHPSFGGDFLPRTRAVSASGFEATWRVGALSSQAQAQFAQGGLRGDKRPPLEQFSVALADPVDSYRLAERATKYGILFVLLTFAAFFVLEMVKRWRIHPMQYLMIGAALVLFFLLLLSLAEHLAFASAYTLASSACVLLLAYYLRHVLGGWRPGAAVAGLLVALYGVLYGILMSEDNALLMGSLLLFGVLAAVMVATRHIDWGRVMAAEPGAAIQQAGPRGTPPGG